MSEVKKPKNGVILKLINVRMSFPKLFERDDYGRYSADLLIEPGSEQDKAIGAAINTAAKNMWGDNAAARLKKYIADDEVCYRSGEKKTDKEGNVRAGYEGKKALTATAQIQPTLLNEVREDLRSEESGKLFGGCYVTAIVEIWPQNGPKYYGVRCQLQGVQHYKDGDSFGSGRKARRDEFEDAPTNPDGDEATGNPDSDTSDIAF